MATLIKNGLVYDGTEHPPVKTDILVQGTRIARLGNFSKNQAENFIDAAGAIVCPGFVDINTDSDHHLSIFKEPYQENFIRQGVTTIVGGNCGASLAPLLKGSLDSIKEWGNPGSVNVNWHSLKDFFSVLKKMKLGVNFGTLVGHTTIRKDLLRGETRDLTTKENEILIDIIETSFGEGALGISFGLGYIEGGKTPHFELQTLTKVAGKFKRVCAFHVRDSGEKVLDSVKEILKLAKETSANFEISHFEPLTDFAGQYSEAQNLIEKESAESNINFDVYPFHEIAMPLYKLLPDWLANDCKPEKTLYCIKSGQSEKRILEHLKKYNPESLTIGQAPEALKFLEGKTMKTFAENQNLNWPEAFLKFIELTNLKGTLFYKKIDADLLKNFMLSPRAIISSNGTSLPLNSFGHERNTKTFPEFLKLMRESGVAFEKAVAKCTSIPAKKYKIAKRGVIKENYHADLVVFKDLVPTDVMINGELALEDGAFRKILAGSIVKYNSD